MAHAVVATAYGGPEVLDVVEVDPGEPGPGEVLLEVRAAGVNPTDWKSYSGAWGTDVTQLPIRLGREASGVVRADRDDDAGGFAAQANRQLRDVGSPRARVRLPVRRVDTGGADLQQHLAGPGFARVDLHDVEDLGPSVRGRDHSVRHTPIMSSGAGEVQRAARAPVPWRGDAAPVRHRLPHHA